MKAFRKSSLKPLVFANINSVKAANDATFEVRRLG